jgi:plastocyanin
MLPTAALAALVLVLAACTSGSDGSVAASPSAAASEASSAEPSGAEPSGAEPSADESAGASEGSGEAVHVTIASFAFDPAELTVSVGDTVRFINEDGAAHTVTEGTDGNADDDAAFDEQVAAGEWIEVTFDEAGDINVTCLFHSNMNMVVHVE